MKASEVKIVKTLILKFEKNLELLSFVDRNNNSVNSYFLLILVLNHVSGFNDQIKFNNKFCFIFKS